MTSLRAPALPQLRQQLEVAAEERPLAGTVAGVLFLTGGVTLALVAAVPGLEGANLAAMLTIAAGAGVWGVLCLVAVPWSGARWWFFHGATLVSVAAVAVAIAASGGATSPAWLYLFFVVVFAAYFYPPYAAIAYILICMAVLALPLLYDSGAQQGDFLAELVIGLPAFAALGLAMVAGKELLVQLRRHSQQLADEQSALRRVASAVATGEPPERIHALVALELATLTGAGASAVLRHDPDGDFTVMGSWSSRPGGWHEPGTRVAVGRGSQITEALRTGAPVRVDAHAFGTRMRDLGWACSSVAPIGPGEEAWGVLVVGAADESGLRPGVEKRLGQFGALVAGAIANMEDRARLTRQASTDPLTGLANHRALYERLSGEVARAVRHRRPLSVAIIDIDHFKEINDVAGHDAGDQVLIGVADCLRRLARAEDTLGRIGGDEFAWVLPEADRMRALAAVERARVELASGGLAPAPMTISAGICDVSCTQDASELMQLADRALYWSKAHGRNVCWIYDPTVVHELSARQRAEHLERSQALVGLRGLARAIDMKDPLTRRHSERVSDLAARLARASGWTPERARALGEAALVHDIGKVGVPEDILLKPGPLDEREYEIVKQHADLGARMVSDALTPEQVSWVRGVHERADGTGYPQGLTEAEIPDGAALLAISDAWDVMTRSRHYGAPMSTAAAVAECRALAGVQFTRAAVVALESLFAAGELGGAQGASPVSPSAG